MHIKLGRIGLLLITAVIAANSYSETKICTEADDDPNYPQAYWRADVGWSKPSAKPSDYYREKFSKAPFGSLGVGYTIAPMFRADINASYKGRFKYSYQKSKQFSDSLTLMANGYLNILSSLTREHSKLDAYVFAGGGITFNKTGPYRDEGPADYQGSHTRAFAWNIGVGTRLKLTHCLYADFAYKYSNLGKIETSASSLASLSANETFKGKIKLHEISIGIIYNITK